MAVTPTSLSQALAVVVEPALRVQLGLFSSPALSSARSRHLAKLSAALHNQPCILAALAGTTLPAGFGDISSLVPIARSAPGASVAVLGCCEDQEGGVAARLLLGLLEEEQGRTAPCAPQLCRGTRIRMVQW